MKNIYENSDVYWWLREFANIDEYSIFAENGCECDATNFNLIFAVLRGIQ